jgi:chromosomal replication initiation ATPase DnaA
MTRPGIHLAVADGAAATHAGVMPRTAAERILALACAQFELGLAELRSPCRDRRHVEARQFAAVRLRSELGLSNAVIGRLINRDHASVVHLRQRAERAARRSRTVP